MLTIVVAAATVLAVGQVAAGTPDGDQDGMQEPVTRSVLSTCDFPTAGARPATTSVTAAFPVAAPPDGQVVASDVGASVALPEPTVAALRAAGAKSIEGLAYLDLTVTQSGEPGAGQVRLEIPAQPLPEAGELVVAGPAEMDPVPTGRPGELTVALAPPRLALVLGTEDGGLITEQSVAVASCTLAPDQDLTLTTVAVVAGHDGVGTATRVPPGGSDPAPEEGSGSTTAPVEPGPPGAADNPCGEGIPPDAAKSLNGYYDIVVTATVAKLGSEIVFGPPAYMGGQVWIWRRPRPGGGPPLFCNGLRGALALPPALGSFTVFRFAPASSMVRIIPIGEAEGVVDPITFEFTGVAVNAMTLADVRVGGTPLDAGQHCATGPPVTIALRAAQKDWNLANGGVMESDFTIPEFAGCGVVEPLDTVFTNLVSGPGNHVKIEFSPIRQCSNAPEPPPVCPPATPKADQ